MILTRSRFLLYQGEFYRKLLRTPFKVTLEIFTVTPPPETGEFSLDAFVGDSERTSKLYEFNALYEREIPLRTREKYGLPKEVNGIVYLSPKQLEGTLGTFKLDWNKTKVHFADRTQVIQKIEELEPLYNSCIGIQLFLKDTLKA